MTEYEEGRMNAHKGIDNELYLVVRGKKTVAQAIERIRKVRRYTVNSHASAEWIRGALAVYDAFLVEYDLTEHTAPSE
jgi:hypothetical protein